MGPKRPRPSPSRALSAEERERVVQVLHEDRFVDKAPPAVYAKLMDEGVLLCSYRTMYRILESRKEVKERRKQARRRSYAKPELLATAPNRVWSWDITKFKGPQTGELFYLYTIVDIFSRYVVGWMVAPRENGAFALKLFESTCARRGVNTSRLKIHSDRGSPMKAKKFAKYLKGLGVEQTYGRPRVSNDNPISESLFKTLKYYHEFPSRFGSFEDAEAYCQHFFAYYNNEHFHSSLALMTPRMVHYGHAPEVSRKRQLVLDASFRAHPERYVRRPPVTLQLPKAVWINPPEPSMAAVVFAESLAEDADFAWRETATTADGVFIGTVR